MIERMTFLAIQFGLIILAAAAGGSLFRRLKVPPILGELLAGTLIGPYLLGGISLPGFPEGIFPLGEGFPVSPELYGVATLASILLLFVVGLETDIQMLIRYVVAGGAVGMGGAFVSFFLGDLVTVLFSQYVFGVSYSFMDPLPLLLGVVASATSVGITARILSDHRKVDSPEGVTILSGAVIDDVLGIILLAMVLAVARSGQVQWGRVTGIAVRAVGVWLGCTLIGLFLSRRLGALLRKMRSPAVMAVLSFGLALLVAGFFEGAHLAMIIGAFVAGLSLSQTELAGVIRNELATLYALLVPSFFCIMGMMTNPRAVSSVPVLVFGLVFVCVGVLAKIIGCSGPCLLLGFTPMGALRVGLGMAPRCEVALIIAGIGLSGGYLNAEAFAVVMMLSYLTSLIPPFFLEGLIRSPIPGTRKAPQTRGESTQIRFEIPTRDTADLILTRVVTAFEEEGFFVHLLSIEEKIYQARKENMIIAFRKELSDIEFHCASSEAPLVNALIYEVLADLEQVMKDLQKFTDRETIGKRIFESAQEAPPPKAEMGVDIPQNCVSIHLKGRTKEEVLGEILEILVRAGHLQSDQRDMALRDLLEREETRSTGMQDGIALPHARTDAVARLSCALALHKEGVEWGTLDGKPVHIFALSLVSRENPSAYLQFLASISRFLNSEERRKRVLEAQSDWELSELLRGR